MFFQRFFALPIRLALLGPCIFQSTCAQNALRKEIQQIAHEAHARVGVAVKYIEKEDTLSINGSGYFPMQSVYKFPLGLYMMELIHQGKYDLNTSINLTKKDLVLNTWSPLRDKYPNGGPVSLQELISATVSLSDNTGCDLLFRLTGGPKQTENYLRSLGITALDINNTEAEMHHDSKLQYINRSTPWAMLTLFEKFYKEKLPGPQENTFLMTMLKNTPSGPNRIKRWLPTGTIVMHKTGSSGESRKGFAAATNDAGIIQLPDGGHLILIVFVSDCTAGEKKAEATIAAISKAVWNYYVAAR